MPCHTNTPRCLRTLCPRHTRRAVVRVGPRVGLALTAALLIGCASTTSTSSPSPNAITLTQGEDAADHALDTAANVLRDHGYLLDRVDHRFGIVTTQPIDSPTALEPWRADNQSTNLAWRSTLNSHRRIVRVQVREATLAVEVQLEQLQQPATRVINRYGGPTQSFREVPAEWSERRLEPAYWQPLGRDTLLEARLLRDITEAL